MSLSKKDFYFYTNHDTFFRYFVDNRNPKDPLKRIFYPLKYETMTGKQIQKYEYKLVRKFLWWGITNKDKLLKSDCEIVKSRWFDLGVIIASTLLFTRYFRIFLFRQEIFGFEAFLENRDMDVKFWKAFIAYALAGYLGVRQITSIYK